MAMTIQDFDKGRDFTGVSPATGGDHNQLVDNATPHSDSASEGKGLTLWTIDTALNTPDVPNPVADITFNKWKRYGWIRIPHATATSTKPILYAWNDNAANDATLRKWIDTGSDLTSVEAEIAALQVSVANNGADILAANATAANAASNAALALQSANDANTTANNANTSAAAADAKATAAQTTTKFDLTRINTTGVAGAGKRLRSNSAGTNYEEYSELDNYVKITETQNKGGNAGNAALGKNKRNLNTVDNNSGNLVSLATNQITFLVAGTYKVTAWATVIAGPARSQLVLATSAAVTKLTGNPTYGAGVASTITCMSRLEGIIVVAQGDILELDHYFDAALISGQGAAAGVHPDAGGKEVYSCVELIKLS